jgi:RNA polymerase sigma-70 factor, ECF subfamily
MTSARPGRLTLVDMTLLERAKDGDERAFGELVEPYRGELRAHCYRMLGSVQDAEDAVQNALLRAWRGLAGFEGRSSVRSWLYSIATNTALDVTRHSSRRELPVGFGPAGAPGTLPESLVADPVWLDPCPDSWLPGVHAAPDARYEQRESVELAFMIMLQQLPALQRAVLILRDVLGFSSAEMASQLATSEAAVNSALQRARAAARRGLPAHSQQSVLRKLGDQRISEIAAQYADAMERGDADTLVSMLTEDATWCMPPMPTWFQGHPTLREWLLRDPMTQRWQHQATRANGQLAVGCYLFDGARYRAGVIDVLTLDGARIAAVTAFVLPWLAETPSAGPTAAEIFARFGLPAELP